MSSIEFATLSKFSESPELQKEYGSYEKFLVSYTKSLSQKSLMTFAKNNKDMIYSLPEKIRNSIWKHSKETDKVKGDAEKAYYQALKIESDASSAKESAYSDFKKIRDAYQADESKYSQTEYDTVQNKYITAMKMANGAEFNRELMGEHMVKASKLSQSAFVTGVMADKMLNIKS